MPGGSHGTTGNEPTAAERAAATQVAYGAVGHLPAKGRGPLEGWLSRGGLDLVAAVLPGWTAGSGMGAERFRTTFFGEHAGPELAAQGQAVGKALAASDPKAAGAAFAGLVQSVSPWNLAQLMAAAAGLARAASVTAAPARTAASPQAAPKAPGKAPGKAPPMAPTGGHPPPPSPEEQKRREAALRQRNIENLARVIYTEARGNGAYAMTAVGHTILNRMMRNGATGVDEVWGGYSHGATPSPSAPGTMAAFEEAKRIAAGILDGTIRDPTGGATHYYSPQARRKMPSPAAGQPNAAGYETTPGVMDYSTGTPAQNTYPDWSRSPDFEPRPIPGIPEREFKFYRQKKEGPVR